MAQNWTQAQRRAIEDEGGALLVSAAAGSGKTAVLVERAVRLICREETPVAADRLLLLTFTNAAAEELRGRIALRLEEELQARPHDARLHRQRMALKKAFIGTIDAFCLALVREHFGALDLPPDLAVGEAAVLGQLAEMALAQTMEEMYADADFAAFAALYGRARSDLDAEREVLRLYAFTRTMPAPHPQLEGFAAMYGQRVLAESAWGQELFLHAAGALAAAQRALAQARALARQGGEMALCLDCLLAWQVHAADVQQQVERQKWDAARGVLAERSVPNLRFPKDCDPLLKGRIKALRDRAKRELDDLREYCFVCSEAEYARDLAVAEPLVAALCRAAALYEEKYWRAKLDERALEFSDFEHLALALLGGAEKRSALAEQVAARYDAVMVDEYQDTNELQAALYEHLALPDGSNLFYVGDVKQSIYRFRKANPGIFLEKRRAWAQAAPGQHPAVVTLGHNFRSTAGVIGGINFFFSALMSRQLGEVDYGEEEELIPGGGQADGEVAGQAAVELLLCKGEGKAADAGAVAQRIRALVGEGFAVGSGAGRRACQYGDFCILLRGRANMAAYVAALEAAGLPVAADTSEGLLDTAEVLPLKAVLAAVDNPGDDVNLAAALVGPILNLSADALARLRAATPEGPMWGALAAASDAESREVLEQLAGYRALAGSMHAGRLCEEIVTRSGYLSALGAMEGGQARRANLQRFIAWAGQVAAAGRGGLSGFVRLLEGGRGPDDTGARTLPGHVAVMTIHRSKGLEFPVCILADADHNFNQADLRARVQLHGQLGVGMALRSGDAIYPTVPQMAIRYRAHAEMQSEEMRILYVALTRARDKLLISLSSRDPEALLQKRAEDAGPGGPDAWQLARRLSHADWLLAAALCHPDTGALRAAAGLPAGWLQPAEGNLEVRVLAAQPQEEPAFDAPALTAEPDAALTAQLLAAFARQAPRHALQGLPAKLSVTALAKADLPAPLARPSFMYKSGLTAAERGSAMHAFLQFADFGLAQAGLEAEIERLAAEGYLPSEAAEMLDRPGIERFFASALYGRMAGCGRLLREYAFITGLPAASVEAGLPPALAQEPVMVQGIADAVLLWEGHAEIADYKTDRDMAPEELAARYQKQLALYRLAVQKRLGLPVTKLTLWSFPLNREVDVPLLPDTQAAWPIENAPV